MSLDHFLEVSLFFRLHDASLPYKAWSEQGWDTYVVIRTKPPLCQKYEASSVGRLVLNETMLPCLFPPTPLRLTTTRQKACEYSWGLPVREYPLLAGGDFDVVICSDLLYDPTGWEPILASLRQLTARREGSGQRGGWEARPSLPPSALAAAASAAPPAAVVFLAHRTRNAQEREFFSLLLPGGGGGADGGGRTGGGSGAEGGHHENGPEKDKRQVPSFTCRRLEGGAPQREAWIEGEGAGSGGGHPCVRGRPEGGEGGPQPVWRRGRFPDVALYELSPIQAVGGEVAHSAQTTAF